MISTNILDSFVMAFDGTYVWSVICAIFLLHKSVVKKPPWATNLRFKTHAVLAHGNLEGTGLDNWNIQINDNLLVVISLICLKAHPSNPAARE